MNFYIFLFLLIFYLVYIASPNIFELWFGIPFNFHLYTSFHFLLHRYNIWKVLFISLIRHQVSLLVKLCINILFIYHTLGTTLAYVAPEVINGKLKCLNKATDIYSLAITMFEIFSNLQTPWHGVLPIYCDSVLRDAVINGSRPNVEVLQKLYPEENMSCVIDTVKQCWCQQPVQRFTVDEVHIQNLYHVITFEQISPTDKLFIFYIIMLFIENFVSAVIFVF